MADNQGNDGGKFCDVHQDDCECKRYVAQCHDGNEDAADLGNALYAAEDDEEGQQGDDASRKAMADAKSVFESCTQCVALYRIEGKAEGHGNQYGKEGAHPGLLQTFLHVVGRSSHKRVFAFFLVKLGQGRLDKRTGGSEQGDNPHPEDGSRPAYGNGGGNTRQVSCAYTAGYRDGECLERRNVLGAVVAPRGVGQQAYHFLDHAELDKAGFQREPDGASQQEGDEKIGPKDVVDKVDCLHKGCVVR